MERHRCKLCLKSFSNGRALGGHMRSHMLNLPIPPKPEEAEAEEEEDLPVQLSGGCEIASLSSSSSEEEEEEKGLYYGLRENPKRSIRLVDPEFSFAVDASSVVLQDRESETESSKNPTRRRSKRTRNLLEHQYPHHHQEEKNSNIKKLLNFNNKFIKTTESWTEAEPVSSISDTTTEEDVAFCLMMLSRDKWKKQEQELLQDDAEEEQAKEEEEEKSIEETDESEEFKSFKTRTNKYKCETCNKVFKSYQALGGHRASHKKFKIHAPIQQPPELETENAVLTSTCIVAEKKVHECHYCFRVFSSGQALGGHKRSHVTSGLATTTVPVRSSAKMEDNLNLIDLNLPAPIDDDDLSQIELSAVSDAEFVNHRKR